MIQYYHNIRNSEVWYEVIAHKSLWVDVLCNWVVTAALLLLGAPLICLLKAICYWQDGFAALMLIFSEIILSIPFICFFRWYADFPENLLIYDEENYTLTINRGKKPSVTISQYEIKSRKYKGLNKRSAWITLIIRTYSGKKYRIRCIGKFTHNLHAIFPSDWPEDDFEYDDFDYYGEDEDVEDEDVEDEKLPQVD